MAYQLQSPYLAGTFVEESCSNISRGLPCSPPPSCSDAVGEKDADIEMMKLSEEIRRIEEPFLNIDLADATLARQE